ncbi:MAG: xanthine dehydrogenase family protein subunit M, partial [Deltaproteobacteria bacterium]|nr:xanthine dehydrogenase family protein subunit M [Deltaproteobacteria bacterium]
MFLPDFEYYAPEQVPEACRLLAEFGPRAKVLAGGTDLLHKMKQGSLAPEILVSLRNLKGLKEIRQVPGEGLVIGALATHNDLLGSPVVQGSYLSISQAAHQMASNQIRNLGTVGGNIVNAVPSADLPPILIALRATIRLEGVAGARTLALEDFFVGAAQCDIRPDEILTQIVIPEQATTGSTYIKFGLRRSGALAVVGAAASVALEGDTLIDARVVLSSSAPTVIRAREAEAFLRGKKVSNAALAEAGKLASAASRARDSIRGSAEYRRHLAGVLTKRAL